MKRILVVCYAFFMVFMIIDDTLYDIEDAMPLWLILCGIIIPFAGVVAMLLDAFSFKPRRSLWFWRFLTCALVSCYVVSWYFSFIIYKEPDDTPLFVAFATLLTTLLLLPLLYTNVKFAYSKKVGT